MKASTAMQPHTKEVDIILVIGDSGGDGGAILITAGGKIIRIPPWEPDIRRTLQELVQSSVIDHASQTKAAVLHKKILRALPEESR